MCINRAITPRNRRTKMLETSDPDAEVYHYTSEPDLNGYGRSPASGSSSA